MTQLRSWEGGQRVERVAFFVPTLNEAALSIGLVIEYTRSGAGGGRI